MRCSVATYFTIPTEGIEPPFSDYKTDTLPLSNMDGYNIFYYFKVL